MCVSVNIFHLIKFWNVCFKLNIFLRLLVWEQFPREVKKPLGNMISRTLISANTSFMIAKKPLIIGGLMIQTMIMK